jgi:Tol biopolymer transport system component
MSPNGQTIIFETTQDNDCGLYKISSQGGSPQYVGQFRGGMFDPGGSGKIAVYNADGKFGTIDESGTVIDTFRRPPNFYGEIRNVGWNFSGNRFLVASNTNALFYVCDLTNQANDTYFYAPVWVYGTSPIPQTNQVVIHGSAEYTSGIFSIDISTGNSTLIRTTGSGWWDTYIPINGVSVHPTRNTVLYSTIPTEESNSSTQCDIFEIPLAGGEVNTVLGSPADELYPQWSTDGTKILFCSNRSAKGYNLYFYTPSIVQ